MILHHVISGSGSPLVLIHPVGLDLDFLQDLATLLEPEHRVIRMDVRGHGRSALFPMAQDMADFADDVHETLVHLGVAPCAVAGFSFGGMIAQTLAIRHPTDVSALLPCAGPCTHDPARRLIVAARGTDALQGGMRAVLDATLQRWFTPAFMNTETAQRTRAYLAARDPRGWAQGWQAIAGLDTLPHLPSLRVPTLCIAGELDQSTQVAAVQKIADAIPGATMRVIAGAPHMLFIEQPAAVAQEILGFLRSL